MKSIIGRFYSILVLHEICVGLYVLAFFLLIVSCSQGQLRAPKHDSIEYKPWKPYVPEGYVHVKQQGIDSYVGKIESEGIDFHFDYGMYSGGGPWSLNSLREMITNDNQLNATVKLCGYNARKQKDIKENLIIDSIFLNPDYPETSKKELIIVLNYADNLCEYELRDYKLNMLKELSQYSFIENETDIRISKIYYPKSDTLNTAGIAIRRRNSFQALLYHTRDYSAENHDEILRILKQVETDFK